MKIKVDEIEYELIKNYKDAFNLEEFLGLATDYFKDYEYILGDYSYNKLRLKGFYENHNKKASDINKISTLDKYVDDYCAYECRYFVLKKKN